MISKIGLKMHLRIITKNHAADPEIGFLTKSISKPFGRTAAMPPAWELKRQKFVSKLIISCLFTVIQGQIKKDQNMAILN